MITVLLPCLCGDRARFSSLRYTRASKQTGLPRPTIDEGLVLSSSVKATLRVFRISLDINHSSLRREFGGPPSSQAVGRRARGPSLAERAGLGRRKGWGTFEMRQRPIGWGAFPNEAIRLTHPYCRVTVSSRTTSQGSTGRPVAASRITEDNPQGHRSTLRRSAA
jgi:hypothetical protein